MAIGDILLDLGSALYVDADADLEGDLGPAFLPPPETQFALGSELDPFLLEGDHTLQIPNQPGPQSDYELWSDSACALLPGA